jgi:hypothetical protein
VSAAGAYPRDGARDGVARSPCGDSGGRSGATALERLRAALACQPGELGELARAAGRAPREPLPGPAQLAAAGPRAAGLRHDYELLVELILEGSLLHYGQPRLIRPADPDLALLLGDQLYALGLRRLAELGDLEAVRELADLISLLSQAAVAAEEPLVTAIWLAGAVAVGWGADHAHEHGKKLARQGRPDAAQRLAAAAAARLRADASLGQRAYPWAWRYPLARLASRASD